MAPATTHLNSLSLHDALPILAGPKMNPRPNAIPIKPILFDRCSGGLMSAMYACATVIFPPQRPANIRDRKSTRLNSSHVEISYAVFCLEKKKQSNLRSEGRHV